MTLKEALNIIGSLSRPLKMPCQSWSISPKLCITGSKMRKIKDSTCSKCYCCKGNYRFPAVKMAQQKRLEGLSNPLWSEAMATVINRTESSGYMRLFDSGDLQSINHLSQIIEVCKLCPAIQFWLPTREYGFVSEWKERNEEFPKNLIIRLSALMLNSEPPTSLAKRLGVGTSSVVSKNYNCPAPKQDNKCFSCRKCWSKKVNNISYKLH